MAITFNAIITQGAMYWHTGLWECSYIFLVCRHVNKHVLNFWFAWLKKSSPQNPPPQITVFFFENCKKNLITAILENSSFLAKTLVSPHVGYLISSYSPSGGMKLMLCSASNLLSLTHWWSWQSSIAIDVLPVLQNKHVYRISDQASSRIIALLS